MVKPEKFNYTEWKKTHTSTPEQVQETFNSRSIEKWRRARALKLADTIPDFERRSHAKQWLKDKHRTKSQVQSFIDLMAPEQSEPQAA